VQVGLRGCAPQKQSFAVLHNGTLYRKRFKTKKICQCFFVQAGVGGGLRKNIFHNGTFYRKRFGTYKKFGSVFVRAGRAAGLRAAKTIFCRSPQWNLLP